MPADFHIKTFEEESLTEKDDVEMVTEKLCISYDTYGTCSGKFAYNFFIGYKILLKFFEKCVTFI